MTNTERWIEEPARLIDLEEGFGLDYAPRSTEPAPEVDPELAA